MHNKVVGVLFWRTWRTSLHHGCKDFALDSSPLLDLGIALFRVLLNKIFSVYPRETRSRLTQDSSLPHVISTGKIQLKFFTILNHIANVFFCYVTEAWNFKVYWVLPSVETSIGEVWIKTRTPLCGGLCILSNGHHARKFLLRGWKRQNCV